MKRRAKVRALTVIALGCALGVVAFRGAGRSIVDAVQPARELSPQAAIYAMLDAARDGDTAEYLNAFTGDLAASLKQSMTEQGEAAFAKDLRDANAFIKGIAINEPEILSELAVRARVEYVYADRNEAQWVYLEKQDGRWKIARVDNAERVPTKVPFGTPVR